MTQEIADQSAIFSFLADPATYGLTEPVKRIETHGAVVFLAGCDAYKVKKAVRYPYMDFSTLERRKAACENELAINRKNAPGLYLGVFAITQDEAGLHIGGNGRAVEWAVHMRRFNEEATLDRVVARGKGLSAKLITSLAGKIAAMHRRAPVRDGGKAARALRAAMNETLDELRQSPGVVRSTSIEALSKQMIAAFDRGEALLLTRAERGFVRRCHGDLHLRNIALIDDEPVIFDALEFDDALAISDVLYDLAFLLMDLCEHGLRVEANHLLNQYLWSSEDEKAAIGGLSLLPLFLALRALIRAKVTITQMHQAARPDDLRANAQAYIAAAQEFLAGTPPRIVAIGGLSGTGKTTLAAALAPFIGAAPGAVHLRSDIERKRLFGVAETARLGATAYRPDVSNQVYERLSDCAATAIAAGRCVIIDATFRDIGRRHSISALAAGEEVPFTGIWLDAPAGLLLERVARRQNDASDATPSVVAAQIEDGPGPISWTRLDASKGINDLKTVALQLIGAPKVN